MNKLAVHRQWIAAFVLAVFFAAAAGSSNGQAAVSPEMDRLLNNITTYRFSQSRVDLIAVEEGVRAALGDAAQLRDIEARFVEILESDDATYECKDFVCRQLNIMGSDLSVPVLGEMLTDEEYSDMARYALERNSSREAGEALRDALADAEGETLIGIVNTLGERGDYMAVGAISRLVFGGDEAVSLAAIDALGKMGVDEQAVATLVRARREGTPAMNRAAADALLRLADESFGE